MGIIRVETPQGIVRVEIEGNEPTQEELAAIDQQFSPQQKPRSFDDNHILVDSVRGTNKILRSNLVNAESTLTTMLTSFDSDGFTTGGNDNVTRNSETFVAWNWKASGSTSSDSNGSITSTLS